MNKKDINNFIESGDLPLGFSCNEVEFFLRIFTEDGSTHTSYKYQDDAFVSSWRFPNWDDDNNTLKMEYVDYHDIVIFSVKKETIEECLVELLQWWETNQANFSDHVLYEK